MAAVPPVLGRASVIARCRGGLADGGGVLLHGPAGIGKSLLVEVLVAGAGAEVVLRTGPAAVDRELPHVALYDLFAKVLASVELPAHLRAALDTALLRAAPLHPVDPLALRLAVVDLLRGLAERQAVLLVIDDAQWLDPASAEVLAFAARRLTEHQVRVLVAERTDGAPTTTDLAPAPVVEVELTGIDAGSVAELLRTRLVRPLSSATVSRVVAASGGNPFYALELGRALARHGGSVGADEPLPVPGKLRELVGDRLAPLPEGAWDVLRLVTVAVRPGLDLLPLGDPGLDAAMAAGVLVADEDGALRFSHALVAEVVAAEATAAQWTAAHARMAALVTDPIERARHRALATPRPDGSIAAELVEAARLATARGAPATAADLLRLAAHRTPAPVQRAERLLGAARAAAEAGLTAAAAELCRAVARIATGPTRAWARLLLFDLAGRDMVAFSGLLDEVAADGGDDPALRCALVLRRAELAAHIGRTAEALAHLDNADALAVRADDPTLVIRSLIMRIPFAAASGPDTETDLFRRLARHTAGLPLSEPVVFARVYLAVITLRRGETAKAVEMLERLRHETEAAGRIRDLIAVLYSLTSAYERAGRCADARRAALWGARLRVDVDQHPGIGLTLRALAELNTGSLDEAGTLLAQAAEADEQARDGEWAAYASGLRARVAVLRGEHRAAARLFATCLATLREVGYTDPAMFLVDADLVESLAWAGQSDQAEAALRDARSRVDAQGRPVVTLGLTRAAAVIAATAGDPRGAADTLRAALPPTHPYPMELARAWYTLGTLERRARRKAAAREALAESLRRYATAGCTPWVDRVESELSKLDTQDTPLSDLETQIVTHLRLGHSNRQIATALHLSVKAVEANLTRIYRKLGIRNRAELST
ncbi:helix-turn-helix transcriptional regulator [Actinokineospora cianjurensis]|uniref:Regulatory LuxR family protein n=1 Tax=Actinokineospora cianjurensis TaxID=585224 RepID=A0A421B4G7_9PSEU|nr:LuxR family transcriptional regulator [Actinokineospora cianjurensis]RLK59244.1 regulatory LuxR family protein [Actinokineospora cianjurensis]